MAFLSDPKAPFLRRTAPWLRLLGTLAATSGCAVETADGDYPLGSDAISIDTRATLGREAHAGVHRTRSESAPCTTRNSDFGPYIDCAQSRVLDAHIVTFECLPAEACRDVVVDGHAARYTPRTESFDVHLLADIEGDRVEKTSHVVASLPEIDMAIHGPSIIGGGYVDGIAGGAVQACVQAYPEDAIVLEAKLDGQPVAIEEARDGSCRSVSTPAAGTLVVSAALVDPPRELTRAEHHIRPIEDVENIRIVDPLCPTSASIGAILVRGEYWATIRAEGRLGSAVHDRIWVPVTGARFIDGAETVDIAPKGPANTVSFEVPAAPSPGAHVELVLGGRTYVAPVVTRRGCD